MKSNIWEKCINCKVNCYRNKVISGTLLLTKGELKSFTNINKTFSCYYLNKNGLCNVHKERPIDCKLFPFDILKKGDDLFWIYWKTDCPITKEYSKKELVNYLCDIEKKVLPNSKKYIKAYSQFRLSEFFDCFKSYVILRKVNKFS
jgi:Fe-S-cluster containining protein